MHLDRNDANGFSLVRKERNGGRGGKIPIVLKKVKALMECAYQGQVFVFQCPQALHPRRASLGEPIND